MDLNLVVAMISMIAGIAAAWLAYVAVRGRVRRRKPGMPAAAPTAPSYDAFISYAVDDQAKAEWLATRLRQKGIRVFLARWIGPGLIEQVEKERALNAATNGILLFSRATMTHPEIRAEYAALLQRVYTTGRLFVPVLVDDVELPPFAKIRKTLDLTDRRNYRANLDLLVQALRP